MPVKVVVDANILLSALIGKITGQYFDRLLIAGALGNIQLYHTDRLIAEFYASTRKPKLRKLIDPEKAVLFIEKFEVVSSYVTINPTALSSTSRDPKDNYLLALSEQVAANYLITGDKDLLVLKRYQSTQIFRFSNFNTTFFGD